MPQTNQTYQVYKVHTIIQANEVIKDICIDIINCNQICLKKINEEVHDIVPFGNKGMLYH